MDKHIQEIRKDKPCFIVDSNSPSVIDKSNVSQNREPR